MIDVIFWLGFVGDDEWIVGWWGRISVLLNVDGDVVGDEEGYY